MIESSKNPENAPLWNISPTQTLYQQPALGSGPGIQKGHLPNSILPAGDVPARLIKAVALRAAPVRRAKEACHSTWCLGLLA